MCIKDAGIKGELNDVLIRADLVAKVSRSKRGQKGKG